MESSRMEANLTFLFTAMWVTANSAFQLFRYRSDENFYGYGVSISSDSNRWEFANNVKNWPLLVLGGVTTLTQILSMFGIANEINLLVWMFGLGGLGMLFEGIAGMLLFYEYDQAY